MDAATAQCPAFDACCCRARRAALKMAKCNPNRQRDSKRPTGGNSSNLVTWPHNYARAFLLSSALLNWHPAPNSQRAHSFHQFPIDLVHVGFTRQHGRSINRTRRRRLRAFVYGQGTCGHPLGRRRRVDSFQGKPMEVRLSNMNAAKGSCALISGAGRARRTDGRSCFRRRTDISRSQGYGQDGPLLYAVTRTGT